jgi:cytochrome c oxidase subunit 1
MFILVIVGSILAGPRLDRPGATMTFPLHDMGREAVSKYGSEEHPKLKGTVVLVSIFFVCFVLYYFVNWKYLSELWLFN